MIDSNNRESKEFEIDDNDDINNNYYHQRKNLLLFDPEFP